MTPMLYRLPGSYTVHRLPPGAPLPPELLRQPFYALLRSADELSVCCSSSFALDSEQQESDWAGLAVAGPLDFTLTGIVSSLTAPLAEAGIPVFVISSFDTDYLLVKLDVLARAESVLSAAGFTVLTNPGPS